jgi:hypothetical protein
MMHFRWFRLLLLAGGFLLAWGLVLRPVKVIDLDAELDDPAIEFYTKRHSSDYGGIDQWAYPGMEGWRMVRRLEQQGYACVLPQDAAIGGTPRSGIHALNCTRTLAWPVSRQLLIQASINYDIGGRLMAVNASNNASGAMASLFRKLGWVESGMFAVRGLSFDSIDAWLPFVADTLKPGGWHVECQDSAFAPTCPYQMRDRREAGFGSMPKLPMPVGEARFLRRAFARIGLVPQPHLLRLDAAKADEWLPVRVADGRMWLDFAGKDFSGREQKISVALETEGGVPVQLLASWRGESKTLALAGKPHGVIENGNAVLAPVKRASLTLPDEYQQALWLYPPRKGQAFRRERLTEALPNVDPVFLPALLEHIVLLAESNDGLEALAANAVLQPIAHEADKLRAARVDQWMSRNDLVPIMKNAYPDVPATRAAWALAVCAAQPMAIDRNCWARIEFGDHDAAALVHQEVAVAMPHFSEGDPIHARLTKLKEAFLR